MVTPEHQNRISNTPATRRELTPEEWTAHLADTHAEDLNYRRFEELSAPHVAALIDFIRPIIERGGELLRPAFEAEPPAFVADTPQQAFTIALMSFLDRTMWEQEDGLSQCRPIEELTAEHVMAWFVCKNGDAS